MKFAMFFMAEYGNMITVGCVATLLFLAAGPALRQPAPAPRASSCKHHPAALVRLEGLQFSLSLRMGARHLPRFRYDQLMGYGWKYLVP